MSLMKNETIIACRIAPFPQEDGVPILINVEQIQSIVSSPGEDSTCEVWFNEEVCHLVPCDIMVLFQYVKDVEGGVHPADAWMQSFDQPWPKTRKEQ